MFGSMAPYGQPQETIANKALGISTPDLNILGGSIKDALAYFTGRPQDAFYLQPAVDQSQQYSMAQNVLQARQGALARLAAATTPQELQAAALAYVSSGGDAGALNAALGAGKQEIKSYAKDQDLYTTDPVRGQTTLIRAGSYKPTPNEPYNPDGTANTAFPQYTMGLKKI